MIQEILHVSSRCGGGKSREGIRELVQHLANSQPVNETYLFASNTLALSEQNYRFTLEEARQYPQSPIPIEKVDSNSAVGSVAEQIKNLLDDGFKGVVFISHKALAVTPARLLRNLRVVIDEVPQDLAGTLMVRHDPSNQNTSWEQYLHISNTTSGDEIVTLAPSANRQQVMTLIHNIRSGFDNTLSYSVADLLEQLLFGHEPIYRGNTTVDGKPCRMYQSVHYHHLKNLVDNVSYLAILCAQLKDTLFGFICEELLGLTIIEQKINANTLLEKKHKNRVRIIPVLAKGEWSTALREKPVNENLVKRGQLVTSDLPVGLYAQEFAASVLGQHDFLLTLNTNEQMLESLKYRGIVRTTTKVQGMNHLTYLDHAVYLASTNLTPFDERIYRKFASDRGVSADRLLHALKVERSYETAYQCVARTSIRNPSSATTKLHTIIVPDKKYADYIASWFEPGYAKVDHQQSFFTKYEYDLWVAKQKRFAIVVDILRKKSAKVATLKELIATAGISKAAYYDYVDEFRLELFFKGLLKPKSSKGKTVGDLYPTLKWKL